MRLSTAELKGLIDKLHQAKLASTGPGQGHFCEALVLENGVNYRIVKKDQGNQQQTERRLKKHGHEVETIDGDLFVKIPLGMHGRSALVIDTEDGTIHCAECLKYL